MNLCSNQRARTHGLVGVRFAMHFCYINICVPALLGGLDDAGGGNPNGCVEHAEVRFVRSAPWVFPRFARFSQGLSPPFRGMFVPHEYLAHIRLHFLARGGPPSRRPQRQLTCALICLKEYPRRCPLRGPFCRSSGRK